MLMLCTCISENLLYVVYCIFQIMEKHTDSFNINYVYKMYLKCCPNIWLLLKKKKKSELGELEGFI